MWAQVTLPVSSGGRGIKNSVMLAPSAFLASDTDTSVLVHQILLLHMRDTPSPLIQDMLSTWRQGHDADRLSAPARRRGMG